MLLRAAAAEIRARVLAAAALFRGRVEKEIEAALIAAERASAGDTAHTKRRSAAADSALAAELAALAGMLRVRGLRSLIAEYSAG